LLTGQIKRHHLMGEVRYIWPDLTSPKAQIQFSSLVEGMHLRGMCAVVRWVLKDRAEPVIGLCVPDFSYPGEEKRLDFMFWVKVGQNRLAWASIGRRRCGCISNRRSCRLPRTSTTSGSPRSRPTRRARARSSPSTRCCRPMSSARRWTNSSRRWTWTRTRESSTSSMGRTTRWTESERTRNVILTSLTPRAGSLSRSHGSIRSTRSTLSSTESRRQSSTRL
jgi:hypothetical protein